VDGAISVSMLGVAPRLLGDVETMDKVDDRRRPMRYESDRENLRRWDLRQCDLLLDVVSLTRFSLS
jgi:hypothetical protein